MLKTTALALAVLMTATLGTSGSAFAGSTRLTRVGQTTKRLKMKKFRPTLRGKIIIFARSGDIAF